MNKQYDALSEALKHSATGGDPVLNCEICFSQIPGSAGLSEEVNDMVYFFCGADCYEEWHNTGKTGKQ